MQGEIERKSFNFTADNCKIWHQGNCFVDLQSTFRISAEVNPINKRIKINIDNSDISEYIIDTFSFSEISSNRDRILWSNNLANSGAGADHKEPCYMSLFYYSGRLSKVTFSIHNPEILIEFISNQDGKISDVENPLKKIARELGLI
jgi:hypothetical protein